MFEREKTEYKAAESVLPHKLNFRTFLATLYNISCPQLVFLPSKYFSHTSFARLNVAREDSSSGFMAQNNPCQAPGINYFCFTLK